MKLKVHPNVERLEIQREDTMTYPITVAPIRKETIKMRRRALVSKFKSEK